MFEFSWGRAVAEMIGLRDGPHVSAVSMRELKHVAGFALKRGMRRVRDR
jgi:hypothetical protein